MNAPARRTSSRVGTGAIVSRSRTRSVIAIASSRVQPDVITRPPEPECRDSMSWSTVNGRAGLSACCFFCLPFPPTGPAAAGKEGTVRLGTAQLGTARLGTVRLGVTPVISRDGSVTVRDVAVTQRCSAAHCVMDASLRRSRKARARRRPDARASCASRNRGITIARSVRWTMPRCSRRGSAVRNTSAGTRNRSAVTSRSPPVSSTPDRSTLRSSS